MTRTRKMPSSPDNVISIVGPGMRIVGDCESSDTIRIEGTIDGNVRAEKGVVVGKGGRVNGDIHTADARIAGSVKGLLVVTGRLELEATAVVDGEINAARLHLDEGGIINGAVSVGRQDAAAKAPKPVKKAAEPKAPASNGSLFASGQKRKVAK